MYTAVYPFLFGLCSVARQRYRVRDDKRRNEDRAAINGTGGGFESRGTTSWSDTNKDKGYLGGLGKYSHKKDAAAAVAAANSMIEQNAGYANAPAYTYNPQTNSVTPAYMQPAMPAPATSMPYGQQYSTPYQNGTAANYAAYQQPAMQYAAPTQPVMPPQPPQQMYYAPPPPPPPPPPGQ